jgi:MgtC family
MRLPLGILTGVGFIGGGAILRRGDIVSGVTPAATMWLATVVGLLLRRRPERTRNCGDRSRVRCALADGMD